MAQEITLTTDGMLLNWLKEVGDSVSAGDVVAELEADKATIEIEAPQAGVLLEFKAEVGDELSEGEAIALIGSADEANQGAQASSANGGASAESASQDESASASESETPAETSSGNGAVAATTPEGRIKASPLARRVAEDRGVNLANVAGSGPGGRIVKADVENFDPATAPAPEQPAQPEASPTAAPALRGQTYGKLPQGDDVEILDISRMRRAIADNTLVSQQQVPHFYVTVDIHLDAMLTLRKQLNADLESEGVKISVNDMIVKATALTLRKFPNLNTHYYGDKLVRHKRVNVGIAVALPNNGLLNVVSRDADKTALSAMALSHKDMISRAREGKLKPDDMRGATFTVSNLGPYGVHDFGAIINPPEAGILAIAASRQTPIVVDGELSIATMMKATISVDHRVSDGAEGAAFMQAFQRILEQPMRLLV